MTEKRIAVYWPGATEPSMYFIGDGLFRASANAAFIDIINTELPKTPDGQDCVVAQVPSTCVIHILRDPPELV